MDLEAEMAKLQAEARRELEARQRRDEEDAAQLERERPARAPGPQHDTDLAGDPTRTGGPGGVELDLLDGAAARLAAAQLRRHASQALSPDVREGVGEAVGAAARLSIPAKLALGVGATLAAVVLWKLFLGPLVSALISIGVLVLIVLAIVKLLGFKGKPGADGDRPGAP